MGTHRTTGPETKLAGHKQTVSFSATKGGVTGRVTLQRGFFCRDAKIFFEPPQIKSNPPGGLVPDQDRAAQQARQVWGRAALGAAAGTPCGCGVGGNATWTLKKKKRRHKKIQIWKNEEKYLFVPPLLLAGARATWEDLVGVGHGWMQSPEGGG